MPDTMTLQITAMTMDGLPANDPQMTVQVREVFDNHDVVSQRVVKPYTGDFKLDLDRGDSMGLLSATPEFIRYDGFGPANFFPYGQDQKQFKHSIVRLPNAWLPQFRPWGTLVGDRFQRLGEILADCKQVDDIAGMFIGDLQVKYDSLDTSESLSKMALLNLYAVLSDETDPLGEKAWIGYVRSVVRIGRERFIAEVDVDFYENIDTIIKNLDTFGAQGFFPELDPVAAGHGKNIPARYGPFQSMISVKKRYRQGNVQFTLSRFDQPQGKPIYLLDCDMDEHANLVAHCCDIIQHWFNGGTHPIAMHEYIVADSAASSSTGISTVDLGYTLV